MPVEVVRHGARKFDRAKRRARGRRGAATLWVLGLLGISLILGGIVVGWAQLVAEQAGLQARTDAMALAAASALADDALLIDSPLAVYRASLEQTWAAAEAEADLVRVEGNALGPASQALAENQLQLSLGVVPDAFAPNRAQAYTALGDAPRTAWPNAVRILTRGSASGAAGLLSRLSAQVIPAPQALSAAMVDNHVVGFQPTPRTNSPLLPLAVDAQSWAASRSQDTNSNGILELELRLRVSGNGGANAALVSFSGSFDPQRALGQVEEGISLADVEGSDGVVGPATSAVSRSCRGTQTVGTIAARLRSELAGLESQGQPRRALAIYNGRQATTTQFPIIGFAAVRVLSATIASNRLVVRVEPCVLIHTTVWTVAAGDAVSPEANRHLFKLCLAR